MKYRGLHIVESRSSRGTMQGYMVKRLVGDDNALHLIPETFGTIEAARKWATQWTNEGATCGHPLNNKMDKTLLVFK